MWTIKETLSVDCGRGWLGLTFATSCVVPQMEVSLPYIKNQIVGKSLCPTMKSRFKEAGQSMCKMWIFFGSVCISDTVEEFSKNMGFLLGQFCVTLCSFYARPKGAAVFFTVYQWRIGACSLPCWPMFALPLRKIWSEVINIKAR